MMGQYKWIRGGGVVSPNNKWLFLIEYGQYPSSFFVIGTKFRFSLPGNGLTRDRMLIVILMTNELSP